ncbi:hypothetical protein M434DRAFT_391935 [Hypoxylon sp. CO27-5]|nr:hypothetical protein M434DRAFT_391935 [Hypoxylon sp. CO27-5]
MHGYAAATVTATTTVTMIGWMFVLSCPVLSCCDFGAMKNFLVCCLVCSSRVFF